MSILIKSATVLDPGSPFHQKKTNIFISDAGIIKSIGRESPEANRIVEGRNLHVSIGWFDMRANYNDPGNEHKEDLHSGLKCAEAGGFTGVALLPNTTPCVASKNEVAYLTAGNHKNVTTVYPLGAVTRDCKGEELTEILDMHAAGAVAFTDGEQPIWNTDIMLKSLLYLQKFGGLLINKPEDKYLTAFGNMNEGVTSTYLGLKGMPGLAEDIMIKRDIELLKYAGGRLHFANVSTNHGLRQVAKAKSHGLAVTCDVAVYNMLYDDTRLMQYDTNYKVNPPLRTKQDVRSLNKGISKGTIDVIVSAHTPQDEESKKLEFDHADFGMLGQQTFFSSILQLLPNDDWISALPLFTVNPRKILGVPLPVIKEGEKANITVFDPDAQWTYSEKNNYSKSMNSPLLGSTLQGAVIGVINNGHSFFNSFI